MPPVSLCLSSLLAACVPVAGVWAGRPAVQGLVADAGTRPRPLRFAFSQLLRMRVLACDALAALPIVRLGRAAGRRKAERVTPSIQIPSIPPLCTPGEPSS